MCSPHCLLIGFMPSKEAAFHCHRVLAVYPPHAAGMVGWHRLLAGDRVEAAKFPSNRRLDRVRAEDSGLWPGQLRGPHYRRPGLHRKHPIRLKSKRDSSR